jgi:Na+/melibiose symporter-like transporter
VAALTRLQVAGYGALGLPLAFAALPLYIYAPRFYAGLGMPLAAAGAILLTARAGDALIDPWLGTLSDRAARPKRFIAGALLLLGLGLPALFNPPRPGPALWIWFSATLALVYLGFSAANIAYQAWGARISQSPHERTVVAAWREGLGLAGVLLASVLPQVFAPTVEAGLAAAGWAFVPVLALCAACTLAVAPAGPRGTPRPWPMRAALRHALRSPRFLRLLAVFALNGVAAALPATLFLFFVDDVLDLARHSGSFLALYFVAAALALPLWVAVSRHTGKPRAWLLAMALATASFMGAYFLAPGDGLWFAVICGASGVALGADLALPASILADVIAGDGAGGREGSYFGIWNLVTKLNLALAAGVSLPLLAAAGYHSGGATGLPALRLAYCLAPCILKLLAAALLARSTSSLGVTR